MTKIEKLEREKKIWKYVPIGTTVFFLLGIEAMSLLVWNNEIGKIIAFTIIVVVLSVINYFVQKDNAKGAIANCDHNIELELLKPEIKEQFNLTTEDYVEVFFNTETYKSENPVEIAFTIEGRPITKLYSYLEIIAIQEVYGIKFYAKLISEDEIEITVEWNGPINLGEKFIIKDFSHFRKYFKTEP